MKKIPLTQGKFALVDDVDYSLLSKVKWYTKNSNGYAFYAVRNAKRNGKRVKDGMHRVIMNAPVNMVVDHKDGDGLNNTRSNLRVCSHTQNLQNSINHNHMFKGIYWDKKHKRWQAQISDNGKRIFLGRYFCALKAAKAYDIAAQEKFGEFANLNFKKE